MATAQYETRTRTLEETLVVLTLSEDEADELRALIDRADNRGVLSDLRDALRAPAAGDLYNHDGITYDLTAKYQDQDGDYWTFRRYDDEVRGYCGRDIHRDYSSLIGPYSDTLAEAVRSYGPLTKVTP
jgi:hypothetical protein